MFKAMMLFVAMVVNGFAMDDFDKDNSSSKQLPVLRNELPVPHSQENLPVIITFDTGITVVRYKENGRTPPSAILGSSSRDEMVNTNVKYSFLTQSEDPKRDPGNKGDSEIMLFPAKTKENQSK